MDSTKTTARLMAKFQRQARDRMSDGRSAWHELHRAAHGTSDLVGKKLPPLVADRIARQLYDVLEQAKPAMRTAGVSMTQLARTAFGDHAADSKNIARLCLPPGADPIQRGIRRNALQFKQLISAIAAHTGFNEELLADDVLAGTPLHPASASTPGFDELDYLGLALSQIVNQVDREFDLFRTFQQTAMVRRAGLESGSKLCWPQYDLWPPSDERDLDRYNTDWQRAMDPAQTWWADDEQFGLPSDTQWQPYGFGSGVLQDEDFFYIPHAPLGEILLWNLPNPETDRAAYELALTRELEEFRQSNPQPGAVRDDFDEVARRPVGQTSSVGADGQPGWNFPYHWWILIYPDPRGRRLVPVLYQPGEEGGAYLMPLDLQTLAMLRHAVWVSPTSHMPVTVRLRQLLSDPEAPLLRAFRRTAPWLAHNPVLQAEERRRTELDALAAVVARQRRPD